jgi:HipA-like protein
MQQVREVLATRYVTPLREGGSLPGIMEADDDGTYVVKFRGAGQGPKALIAELIAGGLARALGLPVPELVLIDVDPELGRVEPDQEVQDLLRASAGRNLGVDFLPSALGFDPLVWSPDAELAAAVIWFDALVENVDRSWRNPNLLMWHGRLWLIDHGATLYFAHSWKTAATKVGRPYDAAGHVLAPFVPDLARGLADADATLAPRVTAAVLDAVSADVPDDWLLDDPSFASADAARGAYRDHLLARLDARASWLPGTAA